MSDIESNRCSLPSFSGLSAASRCSESEHRLQINSALALRSFGPGPPPSPSHLLLATAWVAVLRRTAKCAFRLNKWLHAAAGPPDDSSACARFAIQRYAVDRLPAPCQLDPQLSNVLGVQAADPLPIMSLLYVVLKLATVPLHRRKNLPQQLLSDHPLLLLLL